ncbi:hypothetical protein NE237_007416 [Protea cynaroides]|uniref:Uncharacterized protein n=1 Tax=Protea cynaroides TaxID=273540 RepID=A0A9Q0KP67_9MAGN|nr:hypothetical protein NE237_007416 [Protea cynaroides]
MALTNFILTVAGVGAVVLLFRSDVKHSAAIFRRNVRQIRHWLEEDSASASKAAEKFFKIEEMNRGKEQKLTWICQSVVEETTSPLPVGLTREEGEVHVAKKLFEGSRACIQE